MKKKPRTIVTDHKKNFETLCKAVRSGQVCLMDCIAKATGEHVATICAVNFKPDQKECYEFLPFATLINGNPFELLESPMQGEEG